MRGCYVNGMELGTSAGGVTDVCIKLKRGHYHLAPPCLGDWEPPLFNVVRQPNGNHPSINSFEFSVLVND